MIGVLRMQNCIDLQIHGTIEHMPAWEDSYWLFHPASTNIGQYSLAESQIRDSNARFKRGSLR